ncbi:MAG: nickel pincer cofactor biosynthesis protein LarB [Candidatus Omnitrophota bacterium]
MSTRNIIEKLLKDFKKNKVSAGQILTFLKDMPYKNIKFANVDTHRMLRKGFPEVLFCQNKTPSQIIKIAGILSRNSQPLLLTKLESATFSAIKKSIPGLLYNEEAKIAYRKIQRRMYKKKKGVVLIITGGTSDIPASEEAAVTLEVMGNRVKRLYDVGVAGIHRLLDKQRLLHRASVIIVVAGMEGALPSVVAGLTDKPVIAVPTSIGYGASFRGLAALLTMLNSCASGIVVVNIDNGFGAGYFADLINR